MRGCRAACGEEEEAVVDAGTATSPAPRGASLALERAGGRAKADRTAAKAGASSCHLLVVSAYEPPSALAQLLAMFLLLSRLIPSIVPSRRTLKQEGLRNERPAVARCVFYALARNIQLTAVQ